jgi:hypothetical protein
MENPGAAAPPEDEPPNNPPNLACNFLSAPGVLGLVVTATRFIPGHIQLLIKTATQSIKLFVDGTQNQLGVHN